MIAVSVRAVMQMKEILGGRDRVVSMPEGSRVCDVLETLREVYGQPLMDFLNTGAGAEGISNVSYLVNGRNVLFGEGLQTELADDDRLYVMLPLGGG